MYVSIPDLCTLSYFKWKPVVQTLARDAQLMASYIKCLLMSTYRILDQVINELSLFQYGVSAFWCHGFSVLFYLVFPYEIHLFLISVYYGAL